MRILLSEGSGLTSRQAARLLHDDGHHVGVLSSDPIALTRWTHATRAWHPVPAFGADPLRWLDAAATVVAEHDYDLLLPTQEQVVVLSWAAEHGRLGPITTVVPPFAALAAVQDKVSATATLHRLGLPQPPTTVLRPDDPVPADALPGFLKAPIGTASGAVRLVEHAEDVAAAVHAWREDGTVTADEAVVLQQPAEGPLAMLQGVFDHGRPVVVHANLRVEEGARGGASHKQGLAAGPAHEVLTRLGRELGWHGALAADAVLTEHGPVLIDVNPRLVEPASAHAAGLDLVEALVALGRGEHPPRQGPPQDGVRTHQLLLAVLGAAQHGEGRRGVLRTLWRSARGTGPFAGSQEELTPLADDPRTAVPLVVASAATLVAPSTWTWFSSGSVSAYALSPAGWRTLVAADGGPVVDGAALSPGAGPRRASP